MNTRPARLLIADDHLLFAQACKKMLQPEFEVVGVVTDGLTLVRTAIQLRPDACVIDVCLPRLSGLEAARRIKLKVPSCGVLFLTMNRDPEIAADAFLHGASGFVLKHSGSQEFLTAIRHIVVGESYLSPLIARETLALISKQKGEQNPNPITSRQVEVLQLLAEGLSLKEAANLLNIKPAAVAFHKYRMMHKLGITTNAGLYEYAMKLRLVAP